MMKYYELLSKGKYNIVEKEIKTKLEDDKENSLLWYLLFLCQNNNYIDTNFNNINNQKAFDNAIKYSSIKDEFCYKMEFLLYKNLSYFKGMDKVFRYYQMKEYDACLDNIIEAINHKMESFKGNLKDLYDSIEYIFSDKSSVNALNIQLLILEVLFKLTNDFIFIDLLNSIKSNELFSKSIFSLDDYCNLDFLDKIRLIKLSLTDFKTFYNDVIKPIENKAIEALNNEDKSKYSDALKKLTVTSIYSDESLFILGCYYELVYETKDINKAIIYYKEAALKNNSLSFLRLGIIYEDLNDIKEAFNYYIKASKLNVYSAQYKVGEFYFEGKYVTKDIKNAIMYFNKAMENGSKDAMMKLGEMYLLGDCVEKDEKMGVDYIIKAADKGHNEAQAILSAIYNNGLYNMPRDSKKALYYLKCAVQSGLGYAIVTYGEWLENGINVEKDLKLAVGCYIKACEKNEAKAYFKMGECFKNGVYFDKSIENAIPYYTKGAELNDRYCMKRLIEYYKNNSSSVENKLKLDYYEKLFKETGI
ncbi:MAG: sel1 repeat family protein [Acholeplasmatales bacterium]|nr:sel1 repeat family protein [Acholeplasmatales bacterium]